MASDADRVKISDCDFAQDARFDGGGGDDDEFRMDQSTDVGGDYTVEDFEDAIGGP